MKLRKIHSRKDWRDIKKLYDEAFPQSEKKPFWMIRWKHRFGAADVWVVEQDGLFSGLAITLNNADLVLLDYFAVSSNKRGCGIGGRALKVLQEVYKGRRFLLEIESVSKPEPDAPSQEDNQAERERRKKFYLANGMQELGIDVTLFGVDMELLGFHCDVSFEEYRGIYLNNYGNWAAKNVIRR